jgi:hypothetical protein
MDKRYQVFICSTFEDLKPERQAAVEAILKAGHIPAGMELFTAGDKSQMEVIRQWIDQSDLFMLILGARYGSLEPTTGRSYTELEFEYARERGKPFFAVVLSESGLAQKVHQHGLAVVEQINENAYRQFRKVVTSQLCAFFDDPKGVKLAVLETLPQLTAGRELAGWVSARSVAADPEIAREIARLSAENEQLRRQRDELAARTLGEWGAARSFKDLESAMQALDITVPVEVFPEGPKKASLLALTLTFAESLARGVSNRSAVSALESFLYFDVASSLVTFGLAEHGRVPATVYWQRLVLSKLGIKFLTQAQIEMAKQPAATASVATPSVVAPLVTTESSGNAKERSAKRHPKDD